MRLKTYTQNSQILLEESKIKINKEKGNPVQLPGGLWEMKH